MRLLGAACCLPLMLAGGVILCYSIDGLHYAVTKAPTVDRPGDLFSAGLATVVGLVLLVFAGRWFFIAINPPRDHRARRGE